MILSDPPVGGESKDPKNSKPDYPATSVTLMLAFGSMTEL